ncbi:MAG TPA: alpha/beta fold hydrolase [Rudaea sp.]|nr:alpha/beta fold hydrolase [Rudaea sp.]
MSHRLLLAVLSCVCTTNVLAAIPTCGENSAAILQALEKNDFPTATTNFGMRMRAAVNADSLARIWTQQLPAQFGKFDHATAPTMTKGADGMETVETPLQFANAWLNLRVVCSADGQVSGLFFKPGSAPAETTTGALPAVRAHPDNEHALSVDSPLGPLPGTLMLPQGDGPFPAVLLVAGSGPNDRDETIGPNKPFLDLARGLAAHGIASYRYDKRTHVFGKKMAGKPITVDDEVTDDAVSALKLLAQQPRIDAHHVFVLGHSLGALMVPRIVDRDPAVAGAIMLAAPVTLDMDTVLRQARHVEQLQGATDEQIRQATSAIVKARDTLAHANAKHPPAGDFFHAPASYWLSLRDYHAIAVAEKLQQPMLILQGERDYQVTPEHDFAQWQKALSNSHRVTFKEFPGLSHVFMPASDPPSPADYGKASHVDVHVIDTIASWIAAQARTDIN